VSDIDTVSMGSPKALDPNRPIREADINRPFCFDAVYSAHSKIVLDFGEVVLGQGKSHEVAGIHRPFQQQRSSMAVDRVSAATNYKHGSCGMAGDRLSLHRTDFPSLR
jgi:hypothetical protein